MLKRFTLFMMVSALLTACAGQAWMGNLAPKPLIKETVTLEDLKKDADASPRDLEKKSRYYRERENLASTRLLEADGALQAGDTDAAESKYKSVLEIDPASYRAKNGLREVESVRKHIEIIAEAEVLVDQNKLDLAQAKLQEVLREAPREKAALTLIRKIVDQRKKLQTNKNVDELPATLNLALKKPVTLEFKDAPLKTVFEMLSKSAGINFVIDKDVKTDQKTTLFVRNNNVEDVVELLLMTNQLAKKVLNANTLLIYPNNQQKAKDYQELVVRSFYLANAEAKQVGAMLKTLLKSKDIFIDEKMNLVAIRDTPEAIRVAEKLVSAQDIAEPEVILEVEVLELSRTLSQDIGLKYPTSVSLLSSDGTTTTTTGSTTTTTTSPLNFKNLKDVGPGRISLGITELKLMLSKSNGTVNTLANPQIRVKNREKAKIQIGDKVPVITSTSTLGSSSVPTTSDSVSYIDTGIKLEVEPSVYLDEEVTIKLNLEVSNIVKEVRSTTTGTLAYQIGSRTANTVLRLKDGDTQILAGLIKDDDRRSDANVPGLSSLPIIGHLFSEKADTREKTEIVLLITPHIVRNIPTQDASDAYVPFGTESSAGKQPLQVRPDAQTRITPGKTSGPGSQQRMPVEQEVVPDDAFTPQPEQETVPDAEPPADPSSLTPDNGFKPLDAQPLQQAPTSPAPAPEPIPPT